MAADGASLIITDGTFNGTNFGILQNYSLKKGVAPAPLQNQGALGMSAIGITAVTGLCTMTWVAGAGAGIPDVGEKGDIVVTVQDCKGGGTKTRTASDVVALDVEILHSDRTFAVYQGTFMNESEDGDFFADGEA